MSISLLQSFVSVLQERVIGSPKWNKKKQAFIYEDQSLEVVVVLKLVRAVQGISASKILCEHGLFIDFGATQRNIYEAIYEAYFLLDGIDNPSSNVDKFIREFFSRTIDEHLTSEYHTVASKKILSGASRYMVDKEQQPHVRQLNLDIYKTFSGYIHSSYAHIMEMFGPLGKEGTFNLSGIKHGKSIADRLQFIDASINACLYVTAYSALEFGEDGLFLDIIDILGGGEPD
jgi:hypothetical protein